MKRKHVDSEIGFSDAELDTYAKDGDVLSVKVLVRNELHSDYLYAHHQFLDEDDIPALEVVSGRIEISYS